jgi:3-hydroxyacyl-CoA dehydrogenase
MAHARRGDEVWIVIYTHRDGVEFTVWNSEKKADAAARQTMADLVEIADMEEDEAERYISRIESGTLDDALKAWDEEQEDLVYPESLLIKGALVR